ncbi:MAG: regulatory protein RecX [Vicinamibacterales bacterium]
MGNSPARARDPYVTGLAWLARRELSEAQLRRRLTRQGHSTDAIDTAIVRLKQERALDDARAAEAIARTELVLRGRGRLRVGRQIRQAGIAEGTADRALDRVYEEVDPHDLLVAALDKRLRGRPTIADEKEMQRLYRYLIAQGFESERVAQLLRSRLRRGGLDPEDPE